MQKSKHTIYRPTYEYRTIRILDLCSLLIHVSPGPHSPCFSQYLIVTSWSGLMASCHLPPKPQRAGPISMPKIGIENCMHHLV